MPARTIPPADPPLTFELTKKLVPYLHRFAPSYRMKTPPETHPKKERGKKKRLMRKKLCSVAATLELFWIAVD